MKKIGYTVIRKNSYGGPPARCASCGGKAGFRVTFKDSWSKLVVTLCGECMQKEYEDLKLQNSLDWPAIA